MQVTWSMGSAIFWPILHEPAMNRPALSTLLATFEMRPPARAPLNDDELKELVGADGVRLLGASPTETTAWNPEPRRKGDTNCHLWVIDARGIPYLLEHADVALSLESRVVKHSNLTGGGPACCGGELWFAAPQASTLYVNGCSGRYAPRSKEHLEAAAAAFRELGYEVVSFGWDEDAGRPAMVLP